MGKYGPEITEKIGNLIREDRYTIGALCRRAGISAATYYAWKKHKPEFAGALEKAGEEAADLCLAECRTSLRKLINGYDYEETTEVTEGDKPVKRTVTRKHRPPDLRAIIHCQRALDPHACGGASAEASGDDDGKVEFIIHENMIPDGKDIPQDGPQLPA